MEDGSDRSARWIKTFIVYVIAASGAVAPLCYAQCVDGSYKHDGRNCCLCPAGQYLVTHCTQNEEKGKCEFCPDETYSSEPTSQRSCEPCTSCLHPNDNLEVEEPCTRARNTRCRCRQGHYCSSRTEICRLCQPCTICDPQGIKVACTANNDTVCSDKTTDGQTYGAIVAAVGGVAGVIAAVAVVGALLYCKKKKMRQLSMTNANAEEMQQLIGVNLQPYLPDIADIIGWTDMRDTAISTNISPMTIDTVQLDYPRDSREQTIQLLRHFNEHHSSRAARVLIENLRQREKNDKADRVQSLLGSPARVVA